MSDNENGPAQGSRPVWLLLLLFAGSGCSALVYEIVWYQLLQLSVGSTAVSLGILLATFMGGLCLGSLALPRLKLRAGTHPLKVYAAIEAGIAVCGLIELFLIPLIGGVHAPGAEQGLAGMLVRGLVCAICLLPPTFLMGASLPAIVRWAEGAGETRGAAWWGLLYGANTLGAVFGCLLAGFYLLPTFDVVVAALAAAAINTAVAAASFTLSLRATDATAETSEAPAPEAPVSPKPPRDWAVYLAVAGSGATALGAEVVWTRLMGLMLGATVYAFSTILAVFLSGLAIGTAVGSNLVKRLEPRAALGWCQMLAIIGIAWTAYMIADALPYWPTDPALATHARYTLEYDLVRTIWAILPPTLFWGASFPLAFAAAGEGRDAGRTVGGVYAANTLGAIVGALAVSLVLIPWIGTQNTERLLIALSALSALAILGPQLLKSRSFELGLATATALVVAALLAGRVDAVPGELIAYGRLMATELGKSEILMTAEGRDTSIAVSRWNFSGALQFHVAGKVEASTVPADMRLQRMLGHLAALADADPKSVLIVGFGAGVTAGTFTTYPGVQHITICELETLIPPTSTRYFADENYGVMNDPRTRIVHDDARHFVLTTPQKYDVITSDPIHPFVKGSAALYSKEYFEMVRAHLNPGGTVTQWVPLYNSNPVTVKTEIATFLKVFPNGVAFANLSSGAGYDMVMLGRNDDAPIDLDKVQARLDAPTGAKAKASLADVGFDSAASLFGGFAANGPDLAPWTAGAPINRDRDLRLQYVAGLALNQDKADVIYRQIIAYRRLPSPVFAGSPATLDALSKAVAGAEQKSRSPGA